MGLVKNNLFLLSLISSVTNYSPVDKGKKEKQYIGNEDLDWNYLVFLLVSMGKLLWNIQWLATQLAMVPKQKTSNSINLRDFFEVPLVWYSYFFKKVNGIKSRLNKTENSLRIMGTLGCFKKVITKTRIFLIGGTIQWCIPGMFRMNSFSW